MRVSAGVGDEVRVAVGAGDGGVGVGVGIFDFCARKLEVVYEKRKSLESSGN